MGTSSSHLSPSTPEWERVKRLYRKPNPEPGTVVSLITAALDDGTRAELSGPGVACCLRQLLQASATVAAEGLSALIQPDGTVPPLLAVSEAIRQRAERDVAREGFASRFSDLALNAVATAVFEAGAGGSPDIFHIPFSRTEQELASYCRDGRLHRLALTFVGHDLDHVFRYLVARDSSEFIGGAGLPTSAVASRFRDTISHYCRQSTAAVEAAVHEEALAAAVRAADGEALPFVQGVLTDLNSVSLQRLAAGGQA